MSELWKDVAGYEGIYQVSNMGNVKSLDRYVNHSRSKSGKKLSKGKILSKQIDRGGYSTVYFSVSGKGQHKKVHRLVCEAFSGKEDGKTLVNHIDGNKGNNAADNLEWCTSKYNINHAVDNGLFYIGEKARDNILKEKEVLEIRSNVVNSYTELAKIYGVSKATIADVKKFRSWKWLGGKEHIDSSKLDPVEFGKKIRRARKESGLTIIQFADSLRVSRSAVVRWEKGARLPGYKNLIKLTDIYGITIN